MNIKDLVSILNRHDFTTMTNVKSVKKVDGKIVVKIDEIKKKIKEDKFYTEKITDDGV